jgi:glycosyltransferase involved in cell wall biosynthesis
VGHVSHAQVRKLLCEGQYDIIVNLSESEGVPVSLMEAMSFGIPPVATDVGGVRELVADCGELVSTSQSPREVALIVADFAKRARDAEVRQAAREFVGKHYNAEINYPKFIDLVRGL